MSTTESSQRITDIGVVQRLLFDYPIYDYIEETGVVNVAIIGFSPFVCNFIDYSLEVSQVDGLRINISVFSNHHNCENEYFETRQGLKQFLSIDNSSDRKWGNINFISVDAETKETIIDLLLEDENTNYAYILIDTGNMDLNYEIAKETKECIDLTNRKTFTAFVSDETYHEDEGVFAVTSEITMETHPDIKMLKAMSLNCHLVWNESEELKIQRLRNEFRQSYNFNSSFANILSIKYKLNSLGIEWNSQSNIYAIAEEFEEARKTKKKQIQDLIKFEHRRWCINLACNGWQQLTDLSKCINSTKDKANKLHPCLVDADSQLHLSDISWKKDNFKLWDTADSTALSRLDELDKVSVRLYRHFKGLADRLLDGNAYPKDDIRTVRVLIKDYSNCILPFERFVLSVKAIANKEGSKHINQYHHNKGCFEKTLSILPTRIKSMIRRYLDNIDARFFPIFESQKHTNYKMLDSKLVRNIPFILTNRTNIKIGIPLNISNYDLSNDVLFSNIASSIKINPSRVTYFIDYTHVDDSAIVKAVDYIVRGFDIRNLQSYINLMILSRISKKKPTEEFVSRLKCISKRIKSVKVFEYNRTTELKQSLMPVLTNRNYFALEENDSSAFGLLSGMGFYDELPSFIYNSNMARFEECKNCNSLNYINMPSHLKIADMIDLKGATESTDLPELQNDYLFFWDYYKGGLWSGKEKLWKMGCRALSEHCEKNDVIMRFSTKSNQSYITCHWFLPQLCYYAVRDIIVGLKSFGVIGENSYIKFHTTSSCEVIIQCAGKDKDEFNNVFSNPYFLCDEAEISIVKDKKSKNILVYNNSLIVSGFQVKISSDSKPTVDDITKIEKNLKEFEEAGYIINLAKGENGYSFCFSSKPIKRLLTTEGLLLEMYVYYQALSTGYFDEIYSGAQVTVNEIVSNEFDLILVKGYKTLVVEIKSRVDLNQEMYHKLANLSKQYGINATPVLIGDTVEKKEFDNSINEMQRSRGEEYGIITIYDFKDIINIGSKLKEIMRAQQ